MKDIKRDKAIAYLTEAFGDPMNLTDVIDGQAGQLLWAKRFGNGSLMIMVRDRVISILHMADQEKFEEDYTFEDAEDIIRDLFTKGLEQLCKTQ